MSPSRYTEDNLVQRITAEYLAERLGWESVDAHNHEDFGPDSLLGRTSEREVVLVRTKTEDIFRHVYRVYPVVPSPYYEHAEAA